MIGRRGNDGRGLQKALAFIGLAFLLFSAGSPRTALAAGPMRPAAGDHWVFVGLSKIHGMQVRVYYDKSSRIVQRDGTVIVHTAIVYPSIQRGPEGPYRTSEAGTLIICRERKDRFGSFAYIDDNGQVLHAVRSNPAPEVAPIQSGSLADVLLKAICP